MSGSGGLKWLHVQMGTKTVSRSHTQQKKYVLEKNLRVRMQRAPTTCTQASALLPLHTQTHTHCLKVVQGRRFDLLPCYLI